MIIVVDEYCNVEAEPVHVTQMEVYQRDIEVFVRIFFHCMNGEKFVYSRDFLQVARDIFNKYAPDIASSVPQLQWTESGMQDIGKFHFIAGVW